MHNLTLCVSASKLTKPLTRLFYYEFLAVICIPLNKKIPLWVIFGRL